MFLLSLVSLFAPTVHAAALTSVTDVPWSSDLSTLTKHTVSFTTSTSVANNGKIKITFPSGFTVSSATLTSMSGFDGTATLSVSGQILTLTRSADGTSSSGGSKYVVLSGITNIASAGSSYTVAVETTNSADLTLDGSTASSTFSITGSGDGLDTSAPWPFYLNDVGNTGSSDYESANYLTKSWRYTPSSSGSYHGNIIQCSDEIIYMGSGNYVIGVNSSGTQVFTSTDLGYAVIVLACGDSNKIYATGSSKTSLINRSSGSTEWTYTFGSYAHENTGITLIGADGTVYVTMYDYNIANSGVVAINSDGTLKFYNSEVCCGFRGKVALGETFIATSSNAGFILYDYGGKRTQTGLLGRAVHNLPIITGTTLYGRSAKYIDSGSTLSWNSGVVGDYTFATLSKDGTKVGFGNTTLYVRDSSTGSALFTVIGPNAYWFGRSGFDSVGKILSGFGIFNTSGTQIWKYTNGTVSQAVPSLSKSVYYWGSTFVDKFVEWTLTGSVNDTDIRAGDTLTITATSSMLKRDPSASDDNQVQAIISNGDKVRLTYDSTTGGSTIWKGTYTVPASTADGTLTITLEAIAYSVTTDITTSFDSLPTGFNNTGITASINPLVDSASPASSSTAVQVTVDGKTYDKYFSQLSIPDLTSVGDNDHPQFCFSKAYDNGSGIASYTVRVDNRDYLSNISYNPPSVDGNQTKNDGENSIIRDTDEYSLKYENYNRPQDHQQLCIYGKGDKYKLHAGYHVWSVKAIDNAGNTSESSQRRFLVRTHNGSFLSDGAGFGDYINEEYKPGFSQGEWFPVSILQIGNKNFTNELSTTNPTVFNSEQPIVLNTSNPTFYGIASSGSSITLTINRYYYDATVAQQKMKFVTQQRTTANESSQWGINLTEGKATLTKQSSPEKPMYYATVLVEKDGKGAIIQDIPIVYSPISNQSSSVQGVSTRKKSNKKTKTQSILPTAEKTVLLTALPRVYEDSASLKLQ